MWVSGTQIDRLDSWFLTHSQPWWLYQGELWDPGRYQIANISRTTLNLSMKCFKYFRHAKILSSPKNFDWWMEKYIWLMNGEHENASDDFHCGRDRDNPALKVWVLYDPHGRDCVVKSMGRSRVMGPANVLWDSTPMGDHCPSKRFQFHHLIHEWLTKLCDKPLMKDNLFVTVRLV